MVAFLYEKLPSSLPAHSTDIQACLARGRELAPKVQREAFPGVVHKLCENLSILSPPPVETLL